MQRHSVNGETQDKKSFVKGDLGLVHSLSKHHWDHFQAALIFFKEAISNFFHSMKMENYRCVTLKKQVGRCVNVESRADPDNTLWPQTQNKLLL